MDKETLEALKGSIRKWWDIRYANGVDEGTKNCPLCKMFYNNRLCTGCPVALSVNATCCIYTPYIHFARLSSFVSLNICEAAALAEFEFLVSLLPPGETWESPDGWTYYND